MTDNDTMVQREGDAGFTNAPAAPDGVNTADAAGTTALRERMQRWGRSAMMRRDPGQATTEYALVLVGAAVVALLVVAWATEGGGAGRIGELFDTVLSGVLDRANSVPLEGE